MPLPSPAIAQDKFRFAQMLDVRDGFQGVSVSPEVRTNNLNPITCRFEIAPDNAFGLLSPVEPQGASTAELFPIGDAERMRKIVEVVADPKQAHFFNTDCVIPTRLDLDRFLESRTSRSAFPFWLQPLLNVNLSLLPFFPGPCDPGSPPARQER